MKWERRRQRHAADVSTNDDGADADADDRITSRRKRRWVDGTRRGRNSLMQEGKEDKETRGDGGSGGGGVN